MPHQCIVLRLTPRWSPPCVVVVATLCMWFLVGCRGPEPHSRRSYVDAELTHRVLHSAGPVRCSGDPQIPPTVVLEDGLTEDEAVALALWNNAAWLELLAELGVSRAQLLEAGLLTDPLYSTFFPLGPKQLEFTATIAVDAIWLRPIRVRAAELDLASVADRMVQNGLNLMRDVRLAHAELMRAQQQSELATEALELRQEIAGFAERRLQAGDISELEVTTLRIDAVQARADADRLNQEASLARERLRVLAGVSLLDLPLTAVESLQPAAAAGPSEELVQEALAMRPDLRAAELAIEAAGVRAGLERRQCMQISGLIDANGRGRDGFEIGPGALITVPIFNGNRGQMALADARLQQAMRNYITVRDQIVLDVRTALIQVEQAEQNLTIVQEELLPSVKEAVELARRNYERGAVPYFLVLQSTAQFLDSRTRELEQQAALRRAVAELERSVGRRFLTATHHILEFPIDSEDGQHGPELSLPPAPPDANANTTDRLPSARAGAVAAPEAESAAERNSEEGSGIRAAVIQAFANLETRIPGSRGRQPQTLPAARHAIHSIESRSADVASSGTSVPGSSGRPPSARRSIPRAGFQLVDKDRGAAAMGHGFSAGIKNPAAGLNARRESLHHAEE